MNVLSIIILNTTSGNEINIDYQDLLSIEATPNGSKIILKHYAVTYEVSEPPATIRSLISQVEQDTKKLREIARNLEVKFNEVKERN